LKPNRRFVVLLTLLLMVLIGGILVILVSIADRQRPFVEDFPTQPVQTLQWVQTVISASVTAKARAATPTGRP